MNALRLIFFEVFIQTPTAIITLVRELGVLRALAVAWHFAMVSFYYNPFKILLKTRLAEHERFSRRQLKPVLLLERALELHGVPAERRIAILGKVIAAAGTKFAALNAVIPNHAAWQTMPSAKRHGHIRKLLARFGSPEAEIVDASDDAMAFHITACYFVRQLNALGKPELAGLFCDADDDFFASSNLPIAFERPHTIARGHAHCDFRFRYVDKESATHND